MGTGKLTGINVDRVFRKRDPVMLGDGEGLYFRMQSGKGAGWTFRYRHAGRERWMALGSYPDMSLAEARREARVLRVKLDRGKDPLEERRNDRNEQKQRGSFKQLAEDWYAAEVRGRLKHPAIPRRHLDKHLLPALGQKRAGDITPSDIVGVLDKLKDDAPTSANDTLRFAKRIFAFGVRRHLVLNNPAAGLSPQFDAGGVERSRDRALSIEELKRLFRAMRNDPSFGGVNSLTVKLLLATCVRKGELIAAMWSEFDLDGTTELGPVWRLPASRTKTGEGLDIPLVAPVVEWLLALKVVSTGSPYIFPKRRHDRRNRFGHVSPDTINFALKNLNHEIDPFTVHDLRRTARTRLAHLGVPAVVAERCLGHKLRGVEGTYDVHDYYEERRDALQKWASQLIELDESSPKAAQQAA